MYIISKQAHIVLFQILVWRLEINKLIELIDKTVHTRRIRSINPLHQLKQVFLKPKVKPRVGFV